MTPGRKSALQWFHDQGEVQVGSCLGEPGRLTVLHMIADGQLECFRKHLDLYFCLTNKGRRDLHEASS